MSVGAALYFYQTSALHPFLYYRQNPIPHKKSGFSLDCPLGYIDHFLNSYFQGEFRNICY